MEAVLVHRVHSPVDSPRKAINTLSIRRQNTAKDVSAVVAVPRLRSRSFEELQSPRKIIKLPVMQLEEAIGLFDNPRLNHGFEVDF